MSVHNSVHNTSHNSVHNTPHNSNDADVNDPAGAENYQVWSCAMLLALEGKNKTGFIDEMLMLSSLVRSLTRLCQVLVLVLVPLRGLSHLYLIPMWEIEAMPRDPKALVAFLGHLIYPPDFGKKTGSNNNNQNGQNFNKRFVNNNSAGSSSSYSSYSFSSSSLIKENSGNNVGKGVHVNIEGLIVDSGANQHLMYNDKFLVNVIDISKFGIKVSHPNRTEALITKVGNMILTKDITLYDVLVVLELGHPSDQVLDALKHDIVFEKTNGESFVKFNQFNKTIKIFRSDNGTEFVNQKLVRFCEEKGIIHQTSCAYTPQQNGIVERKYRHLLNVARSLILPTSVLNRKSPYQLVFSKKPSLSHLRAFGCLYFATILTSNDKFSSSSQSDGSNHLHPDSPTIDLNEDNLGHLDGSNGSNSSAFEKETSSNQHWVDAMNKEMDALYENNIWKITELPSNRKAIGSK
ncbi:ribonuclease H-like domain-containing protein [Tanacetum coccineum]